MSFTKKILKDSSYMCVFEQSLSLSLSVCVRVLAVYNKAQAPAPRISNHEFKLWTFLQGTESRVATFLAETCIICNVSPVPCFF